MLFNNKKVSVLEEEKDILNKCLVLVKEENEILKKENSRNSELILEERIDEFNKLILELKGLKDTYIKINREMLILKNEFQRDLETLKNSEEEE